MLTPNQLAKSNTEHAHQTALFAFIAVARLHGWIAAHEWNNTGKLAKVVDKEVRALDWLHAIPNGGTRGDNVQIRAIRGGQLKAEGVRKGIPDIFLPWPIIFPAVFRFVHYHGMYIEMKAPNMKPKKQGSLGGLSAEQIAFKDYAMANQYAWTVCYSWLEAANALRSYIEGGEK